MDATPRELAEVYRLLTEEGWGYIATHNPVNVDESVAYGSTSAAFNFNVGKRLMKVTVEDVTPEEDEDG